MPPDSHHDSAPKIFSFEYYEKLYDLEQRHWWQSGMRAMAKRLLRPGSNGNMTRVLDAGCGTGSMLSWLGDTTGAGSIVGIDLSRHALQFCQRRGSSKLAEASITDLPFADGIYDLVVCLDIIQHLPRDGADQRALEECRRVLRPGGLAYIRTNVRLQPDKQHESADYHQYSQEELVQLVERSGLSVRRVTYANMLPALVQTGISKLRSLGSRPQHGAHHDRGLAVRVPPMGINSALNLVMRFEAWLLGARRSLPYGHSLLCLAARDTPGTNAS